MHRSAAVLRLLADSPGGLTLSQVANRLGCAKASAHRLLANLGATGLVYQAGRGQVYRLGSTVLQLASTYVEHLDIQQVARPYLEQLRRDSGETATLQVLVDNRVVCVAVQESSHDLRLSRRIGSTTPLGRGANGKLLLAFSADEHEEDIEPNLRAELDEIRRRGFSATCHERVPGAWSIAAPIFDASGHVNACLSLRGPAARFRSAAAAENTMRLLAATRAISAEIGATRLPEVPDPGAVEPVMRRLELLCGGAPMARL